MNDALLENIPLVIERDEDSFTLVGTDSKKFPIHGELTVSMASLPLLLSALEDLNRRSKEPELPCEVVVLSDVFLEDDSGSKDGPPIQPADQ